MKDQSKLHEFDIINNTWIEGIDIFLQVKGKQPTQADQDNPDQSRLPINDRMRLKKSITRGRDPYWLIIQIPDIALNPGVRIKLNSEMKNKMISMYCYPKNNFTEYKFEMIPGKGKKGLVHHIETHICNPNDQICGYEDPSSF